MKRTSRCARQEPLYIGPAQFPASADRSERIDYDRNDRERYILIRILSLIMKHHAPHNDTIGLVMKHYEAHYADQYVQCRVWALYWQYVNNSHNGPHNAAHSVVVRVVVPPLSRKEEEPLRIRCDSGPRGLTGRGSCPRKGYGHEGLGGGSGAKGSAGDPRRRWPPRGAARCARPY